jgi:hypothetical protein
VSDCLQFLKCFFYSQYTKYCCMVGGCIYNWLKIQLLVLWAQSLLVEHLVWKFEGSSLQTFCTMLIKNQCTPMWPMVEFNNHHYRCIFFTTAVHTEPLSVTFNSDLSHHWGLKCHITNCTTSNYADHCENTPILPTYDHCPSVLCKQVWKWKCGTYFTDYCCYYTQNGKNKDV